MIELRYWEKCAIYLDDSQRPVMFTDYDSAASIKIYKEAYERVGHKVRVVWNHDYRGYEAVMGKSLLV